MKPRILIIINRLVIGGQALDTVPLAHAIQSDFDVEVLYGEKEADEEEANFLKEKYPSLRLTKITQLKRSINWLNDINAYFKIKKHIRIGQYDIVHTHGAKSGLIGRIAAWRCGVKTILHTYHGHVFHSYYNQILSKTIVRMERLLGRITTRAVAISPHQCKELTEIYRIVPTQKIITIPLGVDTDAFQSNAVNLRNKIRDIYHLANNHVAIALIGRLVPVKNPSFFIEIVIRMVIEKLPVKFFIIGDGMLRTEMQLQLAKHNIQWSENNDEGNIAPIIFTSWIKDIIPTIHAMDIIALTSLNEGTPLSIIEAQTCGKPVVASNVGGVRDTLIDTSTGFLVDHHDVNQFYDRLKVLIMNETLRIEMGERARQFAANHFSMHTEIKNFISFYHTEVSLHSK